MNPEMQEAIRQVDEHADEEWKQLALEAVKICASLLDEVTTDDVWRALAAVPDVGTHEARALGPIMIKAQKLGIIEPLGCSHCGTKRVIRRSNREDNNGRWDVTVYRPGPNAERQ